MAPSSPIGWWRSDGTPLASDAAAASELFTRLGTAAAVVSTPTGPAVGFGGTAVIGLAGSGDGFLPLLGYAGYLVFGLACALVRDLVRQVAGVHGANARRRGEADIQARG